VEEYDCGRRRRRRVILPSKHEPGVKRNPVLAYNPNIFVGKLIVRGRSIATWIPSWISRHVANFWKIQKGILLEI
jgi:hypothetical protein